MKTKLEEKRPVRQLAISPDIRRQIIEGYELYRKSNPKYTVALISNLLGINLNTDPGAVYSAITAHVRRIKRLEIGACPLLPDVPPGYIKLRLLIPDDAFRARLIRDVLHKGLVPSCVVNAFGRSVQVHRESLITWLTENGHTQLAQKAERVPLTVPINALRMPAPVPVPPEPAVIVPEIMPGPPTAVEVLLRIEDLLEELLNCWTRPNKP